jgi:hypothetical protein
MIKQNDMSIEALLKGGKFVEASSVVQARLVCAIAAREKQGKTHLSLTAPDPIVTFNADTGLEGVVHKFLAQGKRVIVYNIPMPDPKDRNIEKEAGKVWDDMQDAFETVLANKSVRTIIFDTATEMWEVVRLAYFGKLSEIKPHHYAGVNAEFRKFLKRVYETTDKNLLLLQKMKAEYVNNNRTGEWEMAGFGDTPFIVQAVLHPFRVDKPMTLEDGETILEKGEFGVKIFESRHNAAANGMVLTGPMATFPFIAATIIEGTTPDMFS